jgi:hypothetical protein
VARELGVEPGRVSRKRGGEEKMAAIYLARKLSGLTGREIGRAFGVKGARVGNLVTEIDEGRRPGPRRRREILGEHLVNA